MIELNLLPDVKLQYIKAQRSRRLVISIAILASAVAIGLVLLVLAANGLQKKHIGDLNRDISTKSRKLQSEPQIDKILTVQNQLTSLTALHDSRPAASRLFDYLNQVTPAPVALNTLALDFTLQTVTLTGTADSLSNVNKYIDTLKFTNYTVDKSGSTKAFNNIVLTSFGLATGTAAGGPASYTITLGYDKNIFDTTKKIELVVPAQVTTRSELASPSDLFQPAPAAANNGGSQ